MKIQGGAYFPVLEIVIIARLVLKVSKFDTKIIQISLKNEKKTFSQSYKGVA